MAGIEPVINEKQLQKTISKKSRPLDAKYFDCIKTIKVVKTHSKSQIKEIIISKKAFNCKIMHLLIVSFEKIL